MWETSIFIFISPQKLPKDNNTDPLKNVRKYFSNSYRCKETKLFCFQNLKWKKSPSSFSNRTRKTLGSIHFISSVSDTYSSSFHCWFEEEHNRSKIRPVKYSGHGGLNKTSNKKSLGFFLCLSNEVMYHRSLLLASSSQGAKGTLDTVGLLSGRNTTFPVQIQTQWSQTSKLSSSWVGQIGEVIVSYFCQFKAQTANAYSDLTTQSHWMMTTFARLSYYLSLVRNK